jgi:hypothetical protein
MMVQCLKKFLIMDSWPTLSPTKHSTCLRVWSMPLMYKTIMRLGTIDSIATTKTLQPNFNNLPSYAASVNDNVHLINSYFDTNYTQILARGATVNNPIAKIFDVYLSVLDYNFKQYIYMKQDDYYDRNLGASFTHKHLMAQVTAKFT